MADLARARRRGSAYGWTLMQDAENPERFVETWFEASWTEHLRHHERVSGEDKAVQDLVLALHRGETPPHAQHFVSLKGNRT